MTCGKVKLCLCKKERAQRCCVFQPAFGCCPCPKAGQTTKKSTEKRQIWGIPSGSLPAFACQPALRRRQKLKKQVFFVHFQTFFSDFRREIIKKRFKINFKKLKMAEKSSLTSFRVRPAPKSWSKYTTHIILNSFMNAPNALV